MTLSKGFRLNSAPGPVDWRLIEQAGLQRSAAGTPRLGLLQGSLTGVLSAQGAMNVAVADQAVFVVSRGATDGVDILTNVGIALVGVAAPTANSWYASIYAKQNDGGTGGLGDADSLPFFGVAYGVAGASPAIPAVPTGATKIGHVLIPSTATTTQSAGVVVTPTIPGAALVGAPIPYRTIAELGADVANVPDGASAYVVGGGRYVHATGTWAPTSPEIQRGTFSGNGSGTAIGVDTRTFAAVPFPTLIEVETQGEMGIANSVAYLFTHTVTGGVATTRPAQGTSIISGTGYVSTSLTTWIAVPANTTCTIITNATRATSGGLYYAGQTRASRRAA